MVSYDLLLFMLKIETLTGEANYMPFLVFRRGSFAAHIGDHLRFGIICGLGIICGAVQIATVFVNIAIAFHNPGLILLWFDLKNRRFD